MKAWQIAACTTRPNVQDTRMRKGVPMYPEPAIHVPDDLHLERRASCFALADEPVFVRDDDGNVIAAIDPPPESLPRGWD